MSTGQYDINNTILGEDAMANALIPGASIGSDNTAYGFNALKNLTDDINENSAFGSQALVSAIDGENSAFGAHAGAEIENGTKNALFGNWAGRFVSGDYNTACGYRALAGDEGSNDIPGQSSATGGFNTAVGAGAMRYYPNGGENVAVGYSALNQITDGNNNTAIGSGAGSSITTGNDNTFIGKGVDASGLIPGNAQQRTAIGAGALAKTDNTIILGRSENVGIGTTNPDSRLHVQISPAQSCPAIHGKGDPGILAEGSGSTACAIRAIGSSRAPAIYVEGGTGSSGTLATDPGAPAIHAKGQGAYPAIYAEATGTGAAAIYAQRSASAPASASAHAIHASGTDAIGTNGNRTYVTEGLFAEGSPGIYAQNIGGNSEQPSQYPAIHAIGSGQGYAIKAETSGSVAAIYAEGNGVYAIEAIGSGSGSEPPAVIYAEGNGSDPAVYAENTSGPAIKADGTIEAETTSSDPTIQATGTTGRAIEAQSSGTAIYARGSPAIDAVGSATNPAIHAVGSTGAPGIRVIASAQAQTQAQAHAIYAEGSVAHAIYAKGTGSAPAIYAKGTGSGAAIQAKGSDYPATGPALFVNGGYVGKVSVYNTSNIQQMIQILSDQYIIIAFGIGAGNMVFELPIAPNEGQIFVFRNSSAAPGVFVRTRSYTDQTIPKSYIYVDHGEASVTQFNITAGYAYQGAMTLVYVRGNYHLIHQQGAAD